MPHAEARGGRYETRNGQRHSNRLQVTQLQCELARRRLRANRARYQSLTRRKAPPVGKPTLGAAPETKKPLGAFADPLGRTATDAAGAAPADEAPVPGVPVVCA